MQQNQCLQSQLPEAQAQLADESMATSSGAGAARLTVADDQKWRPVQVSPELLRQADTEMMHDPILSAVNLALDQLPALGTRRLGPPAEPF